MFDQFKQCVREKGIIEKDDQLKQFRNEFSIFSAFNLNNSKLDMYFSTLIPNNLEFICFLIISTMQKS